MKYKMRGFIDPYTLGFLISLIGTVTAISTHEQPLSHEQVTGKQVHAATQNDQTVARNSVFLGEDKHGDR